MRPVLEKKCYFQFWILNLGINKNEWKKFEWFSNKSIVASEKIMDVNSILIVKGLDIVWVEVSS
jgi:hypothetical protein